MFNGVYRALGCLRVAPIFHSIVAHWHLLHGNGSRIDGEQSRHKVVPRPPLGHLRILKKGHPPPPPPPPAAGLLQVSVELTALRLGIWTIGGVVFAKPVRNPRSIAPKRETHPLQGPGESGTFLLQRKSALHRVTFDTTSRESHNIQTPQSTIWF